jgi:sulfate adenylyltransferase (ADP) / ATP adenylyltransferase
MNQDDRLLKPGTLWPTLLERTAYARKRRAILSIPTEPEVIEQGGVAFHVRLITALAMKAHTSAAQVNVNPFLPYDPDLFVAELSPTHIALLNKFNVVDHHLVIVTRSFESQDAWLTCEDCTALLICLAEIDGVAFYNAGRIAGASQRHKHLQLIPLSAFPNSQLPIERLVLREDDRHHRDSARLAVPACLCPDEPHMARLTEGRRLILAHLLSFDASRRGFVR